VQTPVVISGPLYEPVTLAEIQTQANIDTTEPGIEQWVEAVFIPAARAQVEDAAKITLHEKTLEVVYDGFPCDGVMYLPFATPLLEVVSVKYKDSDGVETPWSAANYVWSAGDQRNHGRLSPSYGQTWPSFTPYPVGAVKIRYRAGIVNESPRRDAPAAAKLVIAQIVADFFENREANSIPDKAGIQAYLTNPSVAALTNMLTSLREY
jgi:uncharacterized phiE125 gp8 family phage protein